MPNPTARNFGYPDTLIAEYGPWLLLLRPKQPTLGSLVLVCREPATAFSQLTPEAFAALKTATAAIEQGLKGFVDYQRINYLMLMMVDPDVHFHVIPRYESVRVFEGVSFADAGWPGPPALGQAVSLDARQLASLVAAVRGAWPQG